MIFIKEGISGKNLKHNLKIPNPKTVNFKKDYSNPKWKSLRVKVLKRDNFKCLNCGSNSNLCCHHNYYIKGNLLWEYPLNAFQTLCKDCHDNFHRITKGSQLVRKNGTKKILTPKPKKKKSKHVKLKIIENKFLKKFKV